jgi:Flp pilus assembly protein TadB
MSWPENAESSAASHEDEGSSSLSAGLGAELERKARIAFGLYLVLAVVAWFTLDGTVLVYGRPVAIRLVPLIVLGGLAARTLLAVKAEKIRRTSSQDRGREGLKG